MCMYSLCNKTIKKKKTTKTSEMTVLLAKMLCP